MAEKTRLQKILAECGIASRRKAEELIAAGRVTVNGYVAHLGDSALPGKDRIAVDGQTIEGGGKKSIWRCTSHAVLLPPFTMNGAGSAWPSWWRMWVSASTR